MRRASIVCGSLLASGCLLANPAFDSAGGTGSGTDSGGASLSGAAPTTADEPSLTSGAPARCQSDAACDDGLFCNGAEICNPAGASPNGCEPGPSPCEVDKACLEASDVCAAACELDPDADGDGYPDIACMGTDCDDDDPAIHPGATEVCDPDDVDEDCDPMTFGSLDADADGQVSSACCNTKDGATYCGSDCDDSSAGYAIGDWAHCGACLAQCGVQKACENNTCVAARRAFVTSAGHDANLGGSAGADQRCQSHADAAKLGGVFKAFLFDQNTGLSRLAPSQDPYILLDGRRVANDWTDLQDGSVIHSFSLTETRETVATSAWTGMWKYVNSPCTCNNWTMNQSNCDPNDVKSDVCGAAGQTAELGDPWDGFYVYQCKDLYRLYCLEQ